ncbi:hypothetical protein COU61_04120 [Candidatus Pacearchaeota archaeon CG10_big_fil_rev_8_21_14_0_10_35_13]|nr:MAG: hypothetical protein COU61_04120 [Candidatus Pacearchaeota archaeon CG10_big_fil_rev_8_21_14_0_10_35_13]
MPFENIFSSKKSKLKPVDDFLIIADHREKNSLLISELRSLGVIVDFRQLMVGDFIVGDIIIERKTLPDLISSLYSKRLLKQLFVLKGVNRKFLLLEGFPNKNSDINPNVLRGLLLSIILDYNIPIIFSRDSDDSSKFLFSLIKQQKNPKKSISLREGFSLNDKERLSFILEGFPNIGPVTSKKLLNHYKTLNKIFNSSLEELSSVIGIKAVKFYELLHKTF